MAMLTQLCTSFSDCNHSNYRPKLISFPGSAMQCSGTGWNSRAHGGRNISLALQRRQWLPVEGWRWQLLYPYCEERALKLRRSSSSFQEVISGKRSTMALAFSCDGEFMASGHLTHEIVVYHTSPRIQEFQTLSGYHNRTPWCLTFDPNESHTLYSGCLGGTVCKWNITTGECLKTWNSGIASPVNSIVFLPSSLDHVLVAVDHRLHLLHSHSFEVIWKTSTGALTTKVRLVLHHPDDSRILTAITNPPKHETPFSHSLRTPASSLTTYRLQVYWFGLYTPPDLEDSSCGLLSLSARVYSSHSCVMTAKTVICTTMAANGQTQLKIYSISRKSYGQCLVTLPLEQGSGVSLDLSPCSQSYLLLGIVGKKDIYHMSRLAGPIAKVLHLSQLDNHVKLESICTLTSMGLHSYSCNIALWAPLRACGDGVGVCLGTVRGSVMCWSGTTTHGNRTREELVTEWQSIT